MEARWITDNYSYQQLVLAADVGGTNANIGLVAVRFFQLSEVCH
jgi:glucokinase